MGQLAERFHPALQPFQTRELLEVCFKPLRYLHVPLSENSPLGC